MHAHFKKFIELNIKFNTMFQKIRKSRTTKFIVVFLAFNMVFNISMVSSLYALTTGPSQPEMQGPSALSFDDLVDPFTGDFRYSIPLFEMGDIPLTLNYSAGVNLDQEASWVGLGWSLNPGSITRTVRGLPDDFKEDEVVDRLNIRPNKTVGVSVTGGAEVFGLDIIGDVAEESGVSISLTLNAFYNNYNGFGMSTSFSPSISCGGFASLGYDLSGSTGSFGDIGLNANLNIGAIVNQATSGHFPFPLNFGTSMSSKEGLKSVTLSGYSTKNFINRFSSKDLFCDQTYTPKIEHSFENYSETYSASGGGFPIAGLDLNLAVSGYGSTQQLKFSEREVKSKAYGYLYLDQEATGDILMDFNREKESSVDANTPNVPLPYMTYDIFSISSPGISGNFRAYRNDVGYIKERNSTVTNSSTSDGFEFAAGSFVSPGFDKTQTDIFSSSETWMDLNEVDDNLKYVFGNQGGSVNEEVYFAMTSEINKGIDEDFLAENLGGSNPVEFKAEGADIVHSLDNLLKDNKDNDYDLETPAVRKGRQLRVNNISYLTVGQYETFRTFYPYDLPEQALDHHIAEITVTTEDGTRYVYGLPAYNLVQKEVVFNVGKSDEDDPSPVVNEDKNFVKYSDEQNSTSNHSGQDFFYQEIETPAYAHSYMLTAVLSSNYVDVLSDGPSPDDLGNYIKYTYGEYNALEGVYEPQVPNFKWRTPSVSDADKMNANYAEGLINNEGDDRGNYVYGEKQIWYLYSIETKTFTEKFTLLDRADGLGADGPEGGVDETNKLKYLSKIELFSTPDLQRYNYVNLLTGTQFDEFATPIPLKTIHFKYDYSLCEGIPNKISDDLSGDGKLTLKKIYYTYNKSYKAKYNAYSFEYGNNYDYQYEYSDRWGNYKVPSAAIENKYFPYVDQADPDIDLYMSAWCLNAINLPQGGRLEVEYESDQYAYVQDREATMMYKVINTFKTFDEGETEAGFYTSDAYADGYTTGVDAPKLYNGDDLNLFLMFELPDPIPVSEYTQAEVDALIKNRCVLGDNPDPDDPARISRNLYFRFFLNTDDYDHLTPSDEVMDAAEERPEFVSGYATVDQSGYWAGAIKDGSNYTKAFIKLNPETAEFKNPFTTEEDVHPISKAGWQFAMLNTRYNILNEPSIKQDMDFNAILSTVGNASFFEGLFGLFSTPNDRMQDQEIARAFDAEKSFIRLGTISGNKVGGGHRVSTITVFDKWDEMSSENSFEYVKEYSYHLPNQIERSSGVASYEPMLGADEIPLHVPNNYSHADNEFTYSKYTELPYGESFFPTPLVGYSYVEVKTKSYEDVSRTGTGKTVYEFFTSKDFPVKLDQTPLVPIIKKPDHSFSLFNKSIISLYTASQGYSVVLNDMHGKPKKVSVYPEGDYINPITETEYIYFCDESKKELINSVRTVNEEGIITNLELGVTYDFTVDLRKQSTQSYGVTNQANLELLQIGPSPIPLLILYGSEDYSYSSTKIAVTSKVVSKNGILKEIISRKDGSRVVQSNLLFDVKTGHALLTSAQNEFEDLYYSFQYPAHWMYPGMALASENDNFVFSTNSDFSDYVDPLTGIVGSELMDILTPGDEILFKVFLDDATPIESEFDKICWVYAKTVGGTIIYYLLDKNGEVPGIDDDIYDYDVVRGEIMRSGHRNIASTPIGTIVSKESPDDDPEASVSSLVINSNLKIIQANATEFSDRWQSFCLSDENDPYCITSPTSEQTNPYNRGFLGVWKPLSNYLFLTDREYNYDQDLNPSAFSGEYTNQRVDGIYEDFDPFWKFDDGWSEDQSGWTWTTKSNLINPYVDEVETINALGIYSSAVFGYNNTKPVIVGNNTSYKEIGFENFEDEIYIESLEKDCDQQHFNMTDATGFVTHEYAHSGNFSYYIPYSTALTYSTDLSPQPDPREANEYGEAFAIEYGDCLPSFSPNSDAENDKKYILTFWARRNYTGIVPITYEDFTVDVTLDGLSIIEPDFIKGLIIEDWQRFEYSFTIDDGAAEDELIISISNEEYFEFFVDDIRIQPADAVSKTYVYDFRTQWLMAELDENHFATFYEYDEDGKLVRVKKETEKGIMTIQEGRYYTKKAE